MSQRIVRNLLPIKANFWSLIWVLGRAGIQAICQTHTFSPSPELIALISSKGCRELMKTPLVRRRGEAEAGQPLHGVCMHSSSHPYAPLLRGPWAPALPRALAHTRVHILVPELLGILPGWQRAIPGSPHSYHRAVSSCLALLRVQPLWVSPTQKVSAPILGVQQ